MTSKEMNKFIHWAGNAQRDLVKLNQIVKDHPELECARMLEVVCHGTALMLSRAIREVLG